VAKRLRYIGVSFRDELQDNLAARIFKATLSNAARSGIGPRTLLDLGHSITTTEDGSKFGSSSDLRGGIKATLAFLTRAALSGITSS
jgi:hypothetical protein